MDRLTERLSNGVVRRTDLTRDSVMLRLAAYEDTGLTPEQCHALIADLDIARHEVDDLRAELAAYKSDIEAGRLVRLPYLTGERIYVLCNYVQRGYRTTTMAGYGIRHDEGKPYINFQCTACSHWYGLKDVFPTLKAVRAAAEDRKARAVLGKGEQHGE